MALNLLQMILDEAPLEPPMKLRANVALLRPPSPPPFGGGDK